MARNAPAPTAPKGSRKRRAHELTGPAPIVSRKSSRANARRGKHRYARHTLTKTWEDRMWAEQAQRERADRRAEQGPRHFYGAWIPYSVSAFMGGHPGHAARHIHRKVRRHVRRMIG